MLATCVGEVAVGSTILIQDTFEGTNTEETINDRNPTTNVINSETWNAIATPADPEAQRANNLNGSGGLTLWTTNQTAAIDLGVGYFTANPGVYRLSLDVIHPTSLPSNPASWAGLGFSQGITTGANLTNATNSGGPWLFFRGTGQIQLRSVPTETFSTLSADAGVAHRFAIVLDTTGDTWSYRFFVDGEAVSEVREYASKPDLQYITISSGASGGQFSTTVDNFTFELIPEPTTGVLIGLTGSVLLVRRKRSGDAVIGGVAASR